jgi:hypothetical protein
VGEVHISRNKKSPIERAQNEGWLIFSLGLSGVRDAQSPKVEIPRVERSLDGRLKEDILEFIRVF